MKEERETRLLQNAKAQLTIRPRRLTAEELAELPVPIKIQDGFMVLNKSPRGWTLKEPVKVPLENVQAVREKGLVAYILQAFASTRPRLIPLVFENQSLIRLARHLLRHCSGSPNSLYSYVDSISRYSRWLDHSPDMIIQDVKPSGNIPDPLRVQNHVDFLEEYLGFLQDEGLTPEGVLAAIRSVRSFYRVNGVEVKLTEPVKGRVTYKDRSPKPEELARILDIADLRGRVIVSMLAQGGFREETLTKLQIHHVREDLDKNQISIHVHVEADITKGKYHDYDTFLGAESAEYLRLYLDQRRRGSLDGKIPPEPLEDQAPLIRDERCRQPKPVSPRQIRKLVHGLYVKAGLLKQPRGRMYELRVHSLRKYFKTQLLSLGVQPDYVDYMMGHTVDTYHDIQSLGVDKLRNAYAESDLSIRPKTRVSKIDALKEIIRAWGLNPEQVLTREALTQGATVHVNLEDRENHDLQVLSRTLKDLIRQEAVHG